MHCSRVFRSSAPSDLLPSRHAGARQVPPKVNAAALDQWNGGSAPVAECRTEDAAQAGKSPARHIPEGTLPGPVRSQGRVARSLPEGTGGYPSSALMGAPVSLGRGRQSADQARDLAGWTSGELPGQVSEQLASWPPGADQPPASA